MTVHLTIPSRSFITLVQHGKCSMRNVIEGSLGLSAPIGTILDNSTIFSKPFGGRLGSRGRQHRLVPSGGLIAFSCSSTNFALADSSVPGRSHAGQEQAGTSDLTLPPVPICPVGPSNCKSACNANHLTRPEFASRQGCLLLFTLSKDPPSACSLLLAVAFVDPEFCRHVPTLIRQSPSSY